MVGGSLRGYPASSTTKTDRHDKAEILLKVALNTINQIKYTCACSQFTYNPAGHAIPGDYNIIDNTSLLDVFAKWPKEKGQMTNNHLQNSTQKNKVPVYFVNFNQAMGCCIE
jgi:hypothetical protein